MPSDVDVPAEAVKAAKERWQFVAELPRYEPKPDARGVSDDYRERVAEENNRAISEVLEAAAPAIRRQERKRIKEAMPMLVARNTVMPSKIVFDDDYNRGRVDEGKAWLAALDALEDEDG